MQSWNAAFFLFFFVGYSLGGGGFSGRVRALNLTVPLGSGRVGSDNLGYGPGSGFSFEPVQTSTSDPYLELGLCIYPSKVHTHSSNHTHREHTPRAVGSHLYCGARGAVGGSVPCSRALCRVIEGGESAVHSLPHLQVLLARDSNPQPLDYESDSLTISPQLKLL